MVMVKEKIVFVDGNLHSGEVRCYIGEVIAEGEFSITVDPENAMLSPVEIGRAFIVKRHKI